MIRRPAPASLRRARAGIVAAFAIHGVISGSLGTRIPAIKERAGLSPGELGVALMGFALGLFAGTRLAGRPIRRLGSRRLIRLGMPLMGVALVGVAVAEDIAWLTAAFVALGVVAGLLDVAINDNAVAVERGYRRPIMSSIHGMWSVGMLAGAGAGAVAAALDVSATVHFGVIAAVLAVAGAWALTGLLPLEAQAFDRPGTRSGEQGTEARPSSLRALRSASVLLLGLVGFGSFLCEGAASDWSAVYLRDTLGSGPGLAGATVVAYSGAMVASRFVADGLTAWFGPVAVVRTGAVAAAAGLSVGLLVPAPATAIAAFAVLGASLGPVVPITFSAAGNTRVDGRGTALGWVVTMSYLGSIIGPIVIGFVAQGAGLRAALTIPVALALGVAAASGRVAAGGATSSRPSGPRGAETDHPGP